MVLAGPLAVTMLGGPSVPQQVLENERGGAQAWATHLGGEIVLLQLPSLTQVPGTHGIVQASCPQLSAIVRDIYAAGPVRVALELPMKAKQGGRVSSRELHTKDWASSAAKPEELEAQKPGSHTSNPWTA